MHSEFEVFFYQANNKTSSINHEAEYNFQLFLEINMEDKII